MKMTKVLYMNVENKMRDKLFAAIKHILPNFTDMHGEIAVSHGDDIIYHGSFSYADAPSRVSKNAQYLIGSVTKQFTAVALLKSFYDRQIALDAKNDVETLNRVVKNDLTKPVSFFLPKDHQVWNGSMPNWANFVTIHHLLTHTSGIKKKKSEIDFDENLECTPGQQFLYSNPNYFLIGKVISEITNTSLDKYFKNVLFDPAGMQKTYFPLSGTPKQLKQDKKFENLALGFEYNLVPVEVTFSSAEDKINFDELSVAGGIVSTAEDCVRWNHALFQGKIIPMHFVELMLVKYIPAIPIPTYYGLDQVWYGYGIEVYNEEQKICYQHSGGCPGYQSRLMYLPNSNMTIVHLSNSQKDLTNYKEEINKIKDKYHCDELKAESMFDEQFPHYKIRLQGRMNIFNYANKLRALFL